ncbi:epoxide hydrolase family protein [Glycocaulis sp.]|uniref:epoxide hydrolase family protein n=1 Tax=Glycocaulis sp. TaxID=1969725 RepID=UPI003D1AB391
MSVTPFRIEIAQEQITDLHERLAMARWPHSLDDCWESGQPVSHVKALADHWLNRFDWREQEAALNALPHFLTKIDGQTIHFVHIRSPEPDSMPLLLLHGWPGTFAEFLDISDMLSNPRQHGNTAGPVFDLVIPSLPGFGFSTPLSGPGWDAAKIGVAMDALMRELGYQRYGVHGSDVGALVAREMGVAAPHGLAGIHLQQIFAFPDGTQGEMDNLTPFEIEGFTILDRFQKYAAYNDVQSKRPLTLAYGLTDSPTGLLAWNAELFTGFLGEHAYTLDLTRFLTHVSIYWFTESSDSAARVYLENARTGAGYRETANLTPTGVSVFPDDFRSVRTFAERSNNVVHWTEMPRGGHFAASEEPQLLAADIRAFFGAL